MAVDKAEIGLKMSLPATVTTRTEMEVRADERKTAKHRLDPEA